MPESTRREVLISIAARGVAAQAFGATDYGLKAFAADQFRLLEQLVDMIVPDSDTPGARKGGVAAMIEKDAAADSGLKRQVQGALSRQSSDGFADTSPPARTALLTDYMIAGDERRHHFQLIKDLTVDGYFATEIGLLQEFGYQGNTYLAESPAANTRSTLDGLRRR